MLALPVAYSPCQKSLNVAFLNLTSENFAENSSPTGDCDEKPTFMVAAAGMPKLRTMFQFEPSGEV